MEWRVLALREGLIDVEGPLDIRVNNRYLRDRRFARLKRSSIESEDLGGFGA